MAVEQQMNGGGAGNEWDALSFPLGLDRGAGAGPIGRSDEDLIALVDLARSIWMFGMIWSVFVYFGCRPVLLCVDSICCHYSSGSTWHLKWLAPNGSLSRPVSPPPLLFFRESASCELLDQINMQKPRAVLLTHIHACKTKLSSVCRKKLSVWGTRSEKVDSSRGKTQ